MRDSDRWYARRRPVYFLPNVTSNQALQYFLEVADVEQICEQLMKLETLGAVMDLGNDWVAAYR